MRLTLSTLPQLAVLAKILCLLMVVMCGAVPSTVRSVSLYSTCSRGNVSVFQRKVNATAIDEKYAPYQKMMTQSEDFSMKLYLYGEETKRYICFSKRWKIISLPKEKRNNRCQFYERYHGRYLRYQSAEDPKRYIGFNKKGKPITKVLDRTECYNFIKINPLGVENHNDIVSSDKGGMKHRKPALLPLTPYSGQSRKPHLQHQQQHQHQHQHRQQQQQQQQQRAAATITKNSLIPASESSLVGNAPGSSNKLTTHHRHRHWKTTRRQHHGISSSNSGSFGQPLRRASSLFVEDTANSKY